MVLDRQGGMRELDGDRLKIFVKNLESFHVRCFDGGEEWSQWVLNMWHNMTVWNCIQQFAYSITKPFQSRPSAITHTMVDWLPYQPAHPVDCTNWWLDLPGGVFYFAVTLSTAVRCHKTLDLWDFSSSRPEWLKNCILLKKYVLQKYVPLCSAFSFYFYWIQRVFRIISCCWIYFSQDIEYTIYTIND